MINCPNCNKKMNERFEYCRICGSKLDGEMSGDYSTDINNLFNDGAEFYYLYAVNGKQVILRDNDKEKLKKEVLIRNYPWIEKNDLEKYFPWIKQGKVEENESKTEQNETKIKENENKIEENKAFKDEFIYVTREEDVNFGKIRYYDPETGQGMETWGPDNSERAKKLRKSILSKYG